MEFCFKSFWDSMGVTTKVIDLLYGWRIWFGKHLLDIWNLGRLYLMWTLWRENNCLTFEDAEILFIQLKSLFMLFGWSCVLGFTHRNSIADFMASL